MANSVAKVYANTVKKNQRVLYAVWEPGFPVKLGDYGVMVGNIFTQLGNISEFEELRHFKIKIRKDDTKDEKFFTSEKGVQFEIKPKATIPVKGIDVNASIEVKFSKENCVFFNAADCYFEIIENKYELGEELKKIYKSSKDRWKREFVVVTDRVIAKRALILISTSSNFMIKLDAKADVSVIDLADASLGLTVAKQQSSGYKVITEEGIIPLIGLSKMSPNSIFFNKEFAPYNTRYTSEMAQALIDYKIRGDSKHTELQFSQFTDDLDN